jgi:hypothetical protein
METAGALRDAVLTCINTRDHPVMKVRDDALAEVALLLEAVTRERLDDEELAASLDGLHVQGVVSDGETTLEIRGAFYTLGLRPPAGSEWMLPVFAHLSTASEAPSVVRVASRDGLCEMPESERQFQRAFNKASWQWSLEFRLS